MLVVIGVNARGEKHFLAIEDGVRESTQSWHEVLLGMKQRGLTRPAKLAVGNGALGFWAALSQVYPETRTQRCWMHKTGNVLNMVAMRFVWPRWTRHQMSFPDCTYIKTLIFIHFPFQNHDRNHDPGSRAVSSPVAESRPSYCFFCCPILQFSVQSPVTREPRRCPRVRSEWRCTRPISRREPSPIHP